MRTTVTLEPDVAAKLKEYAHQRRTSFKAALNELIRRGLTAPEAVQRKRFVVHPQPGGLRAGIDPGRLNQLVDELEVEHFLEKERSWSSSRPGKRRAPKAGRAR